jgi:hypothetical protein
MTISRLCFVLAIVFAPFAATLAELSSSSRFRSHFGFNVELPQGWVLLGPSEASRKITPLNAADIGLPKANSKELNQYLERAKTGQVEFYLDTLLSTETFTNNISVQLEKRSQDYSQYSQKELDTFCSQLTADLERVWGTPVTVKGCQLASSNRVSSLAYSYIVPARNLFVLQYEVPFDTNHTLVVVGAGRRDKEVISRVQPAVKAVVTSIIGRTK